MFSQTLRPALTFWANCYKSGVRLTIRNGRAMPERAWHYSLRIDPEIGFGQFGVFPSPEPVEPTRWIVDGVIEHQKELAKLLMQNPPEPYAKYFYHLLVKDYEAEPIREHAARNGHDINWAGVEGGNFLLYNGKWQEKPPEGGDKKKKHIEVDLSKSKGWKTPDLSPVLRGIKKIEI